MDIKELKLKRSQQKAAVSRISNFVNKLNASTLTEKDFIELKARLDKLSLHFDQFNKIQDQVEAIEGISEGEDIIREEFESNYFSLYAEASKILKNKNAEKTTPGFGQGDMSDGRVSQVQLPLIQLPKFNGNYNQWLEFKDAFLALVHDNSTLSDIQKLHYLRTCLQGDVLETIKGIPVSASNYVLAWETLISRYEKNHLIIKNHINLILDCPAVPNQSLDSLRNLYHTINNNLAALKHLKEPVDNWDSILIQIIVRKLDSSSSFEWEKICATTEKPSVVNLLEMLRVKCEVLEGISNQHHKQPSKKEFKTLHHVSHISAKDQSDCCFFCKGDHLIYYCEKFLNLTPSSRMYETKKLKLCVNCLRPSTQLHRCSYSRCRVCGQNHNTLLHYDRHSKSNFSSNEKTFQNHNSNSNKQGFDSVNAYTSTSKEHAVLPTALIKIQNKQGKFISCRALLDSGAMNNFISLRLSQQLGLSLDKINYTISGVGGSDQRVEYMTCATIKSRLSNFSLSIKCLILEKITADLPLLPFNSFDIPNYIQLADPTYNKPDSIDLLLGSGVFWKLMSVGQIVIPNTDIALKETKFGWVVGGVIDTLAQFPTHYQSINCTSIDNLLNENMTRFWSNEEIDFQAPLSRDDQECEDHFKTTFRRNSQGQFVVNIPFKENYKKLGQSRSKALRLFYIQERRLMKNEKLRNSYIEFMREYQSMGHMEEVKECTQEEELNYYIPHHSVVREESKTTKTRVVFNASMKTDSGLSLNDVQYTGPAIQNDLFSIILNFRIHKYVITADICKMYRMIWINPKQTRFQRIFWRENPTDKLKCFELKTVTYGTASAPYLAIRCLHQLAEEIKHKNPKISKIIKENFYVDDLLCGADSKEEILLIQNEVASILSSAGLHLRKWLCNEKTFYNKFNIRKNLEYNILELGEKETNKTLGVAWNATTDTIQYSIKDSTISNNVTKRNILAEISRIFDPLGLLGPVVILGKILIQDLWIEKLSWDENVPIHLKNQWFTLQNQLMQLKDISIPRHVIDLNYVSLELHGFSDASEKAYGACVYIRSKLNNNQYVSNLLCAKSRVAPIKKITLPKLELCGTLLLAKLVNKITISLNLKFEKYFLWTDSTIALCWINSESNRWKTYVSNRVEKIQDLTNKNDWHHVSTKQNPADLLTRGIQVSNFKSNSLWWHGPSWLTKEILPINNNTIHEDQDLPEMKISINLPALNHSNNTLNIFTKYEHLNKLQRVIAYCLRFANNTRLMAHERKLDELSVTELNISLQILIRKVQQEEFYQDYSDLMKQKPLSKKSTILSLTPFLDQNQLIRVGGRLRNSDISFEQKHPIILPANHIFTKMIFKDFHNKLFHCGVNVLLSAIRERYWPIKGRSQAKNIIRSCKICFMTRPITMKTLMGNLPRSRVQRSFPFQFVGVDHTGPIFIKDKNHKNSKLNKSYICLFVCLSTKAIHIELTTNLSTDSFMATLKRFISRRGKPSTIYSDNAKNFIGANNRLKELYRFLKNYSNEIKKFLAGEGIEWKFIPPRSPNFGGLWEAGIKSVKNYLTKILKNTHVTYEHLCTVLYQIEAILNSRPLQSLTLDSDDLFALTPAHFLIGRSLISTPDNDYRFIPERKLRIYQRLQKLIQNFWTKWHKHYLTELQARSKWKTSSNQNLQPGALVVIKEDDVLPMQWRLGRIKEVHPGNDGVIRVATIKTATGEVKRSIRKLCILPNPV